MPTASITPAGYSPKQADESMISNGFEVKPDADLSGADLREANLYGANLAGANLTGANLTGANLHNTNLYSANLAGAHLTSANLHNTNLYAANLTDANLIGADLTRANLHSANLRDANLRDANLYAANLTDTIGQPLTIHGLASGSTTLSYTSTGWQLTIGCWKGTLDELRELIAKNEDWPEAKGEEITRRRPILQAAIALCEAHINTYPVEEETES